MLARCLRWLRHPCGRCKKRWGNWGGKHTLPSPRPSGALGKDTRSPAAPLARSAPAGSRLAGTRRLRFAAMGEPRLTHGAGPSVRVRGTQEELGEAILTEGGMGLRRARRAADGPVSLPVAAPVGRAGFWRGFWRAVGRPSQRLSRSLSHARFRGRAAAFPQQEAEGLGARRGLHAAPLHQAVRERLRPFQGLRAVCGLRSVQVREGEATAPGAGARARCRPAR